MRTFVAIGMTVCALIQIASATLLWVLHERMHPSNSVALGITVLFLIPLAYRKELAE